MDPVTMPLLLLVLGNLARELITEASKDYLKDRLKSVFGWLDELGERDKVELAYQDAMEQAYAACLEMLLVNIQGHGYSDAELKQYRTSIEAFVRDDRVSGELLNAVREPGRDDLPSPAVLHERWEAVRGLELPSDALWQGVATAFRRQATRRILLSDELRELLNAQNLQQLRELVERQGGVRVQVRRDRYSQRMRTKFSPVDLANLMPAYADDPGRMVIRDVFVAQHVRENPPPVEIPKDLAERLKAGGPREAADEPYEGIDERQVEKLRAAYASQPSRPVLDVIAAPGNRLLVMTGEPGSGKSTLMRYLLTSIVEPPADLRSGPPPAWTLAFRNAFPLLIELRDFYALRRGGECDSFLEYVACMGRTDHWSIDDHAAHESLDGGPSLVMFDGLDEIFDSADRQRVMHEIAGFALRYPRARIIVTSRPVGYKEHVLRDAGFAHFGIQDLDDGQVEAFVRGWFALTFPQQPQHAEQRIQRVLGSVRQSRPIRLLAGNPMLLTIMALLAREEELPRERAKFYEKAVEVLCHHWDANRNLELPEDRYLNADDKKDLLRRIAMRMQVGAGGLKGNIIREDDLEQEIQAYLIDEQWQPGAGEARRAARRMIRQLRERNYILCLRGPRLYGFVHRTFLEYLTAAEYVRRFDRQPQQMTIDELVELFDRHCREDDWQEVLRLICGQIDERFVGRIVEHLADRTDLQTWDAETPLPELPLAIWCLSEVRIPARMASSGDVLRERVIQCVLASGNASLHEFLRSHLLPASEGLGTRWPVSEPLGDRALEIADAIAGWGEMFWPEFVAAIDSNRSAVEHFLKVGRWQFRSSACRALAKTWPDEHTRTLLEDRAVQDADAAPRQVALWGLADQWPDERTRTLLEGRAIQDGDAALRQAALGSLAEQWPDECTRTLLEERVVHDASGFTRRSALASLARQWPDERTRTLLEARAVQDKHVVPRQSALESLAEQWPDERTRALLEERAVQADGFTRQAALGSLAEQWPDERTRTLLEERAVQDGLAFPRQSALVSLAEQWPDERTRALLEERAVHDAGAAPRQAALESLAEQWPDERTRTLLAERAGIDGVAASQLGGRHSEFGRIVFTRDLDGVGPYLDPAEPLPHEHVLRAAEKAHVPPDRVEETVHSLSAHLGWDITKGKAG